MPVTLSIKAEGFAEAEKALVGIKGGYPTAASRAINRGLSTGNKVAAQAIGARYNIKAADIKSNININKAHKGDLGGALELTGHMLPVTLFKPSGGKKLRGGRRQPVKVAIIRKAGKTIRGAFKMPDGRVMERRQDPRLPIFPVSTISVAHMAGQTGVSDKIEKEMARVVDERLKHETNLLLGKVGFK